LSPQDNDVNQDGVDSIGLHGGSQVGVGTVAHWGVGVSTR
jgi:hypothetical protein